VTDELSPEQEAVVRRLLAQARHDGPVPPDVASRLDEALDRLVAEEGVDDLQVFDDPSPAPVTALAGVRQRRRTAGRLLLAAAAVVVGGVAVGQVVGNTSFDDDAGGGADTAADAPRDDVLTSGGAAEQGGDADGDADGDAGGGAAEPENVPVPASGSASMLLDRVRAPLSLTSDNFVADVQRELAQTSTERRKAANADYDGVVAYLTENRDFVCATGSYGQGATLPAYYDGEEAVLVLRRPRAGTQRVEVLTCGTAVELNSVDLPAP